MTERVRPWLPLILLGAGIVVLFHRLLIGETLYWGLPTLQFYPWREFALSQLRGGELPLWVSYTGAGAPLFANYQSALLYPFSWIGLILPLPSSMSITAAAHLFIAGWGMWVFTGRLGMTPLGRGLAAVAFGLTQYTVGRVGTYPIVSAAAWIGWLLWAVDGVLRDGRRPFVVALAGFSALLLLAGHAQTAWYTLLLVGGFACYRAIMSRPRHMGRLFACAALVLLGAGIAALQLAATGELLSNSQRGDGVDFDFAMNFSYAPLRTLNLLTPNLFGTPADGSYFTEGAYFEDAVYLGLIPLVSALMAAFNAVRRQTRSQHPDAAFWVLVVIVGFVFALGRYTPVFPLVYEHVPTFDLFQAPVRWHLWTTVGLSILAGFGVSVWGRSKVTRRWTKRALAVGAAFVFTGLGLTAFTGEPVSVFGRGLLLLGVFGMAAGWLTLKQPDLAHPRYRWWAVAVLIVTVVDLVVASWGLNPTISAEFFEPRRSASTGTADRSYLDAETVRSLTYDRYFDLQNYTSAASQLGSLRDSGLPNLNLLDRQPSLNVFEPLLLDPYARLIMLIDGADPSVRPRLLRMAGVASERAWVVTSACFVEDTAAASAAVAETTFDPEAAVILLGDGACEPADGQSSARVEIVADTGNRVNLRVTTNVPGWLVLADIYAPGWTASINDLAAPVYQANLAFRAVAIPAGENDIEFLYAPTWLTPGLSISALAFAVWIGLCVWTLRGRTLDTVGKH